MINQQDLIAKFAKNKGLSLIIGPAYSGKTAFVKHYLQSTLNSTYVFFPLPQSDNQDQQKNAATLNAVPLETHDALIPQIKGFTGETQCLAVDGLNLWFARLFLEAMKKYSAEHLIDSITTEASELLSVVQSHMENKQVIFISNEVGAGLPPEHVNERYFRNGLSIVNQLFAKAANQVYLMNAGILHPIK